MSLFYNPASWTMAMLPLYLSLVLFMMMTWVGLQSNLVGVGKPLNIFSVPCFSGLVVLRLIVPFWFLLFVLFLMTRSYEGLFFFNQLLLTASTLSSMKLLLVGFIALSVGFFSALPRSSSVSVLDLGAVVFFFFLLFSVVFLTTNVVLLLISLEIIALLLFFLLLSLDSATGPLLHQEGFSVALTDTAAGKSLNFFITFIWVNAFASIFLFWALFLTYGELGLWQKNLVWLTHPSNFTTIAMFFFMTALLLKSGSMPFHFWILSVYKELPLPSLIAYLSFYYLPNLAVMLSLFYWLLPILNTTPLLFFFLSLMCSGLFWVIRVGATSSLSGLIATSSVLNMSLMWLFFISQL